MKYRERHRAYPGKLIISYPFSCGGHLKDRMFWMAELNGEVEDYHRKDALIKEAIDRGLDYVVLRVHRDGTFTEMESSQR